MPIYWKLWTSLTRDPAAYAVYLERLRGIESRFDAVMHRNGWERLPMGGRPWMLRK